jgi:16S rRNA (cytosine1402-N4)-methyltransferase
MIEQHRSIMTGEVMGHLNIKKGGIYLDCTLGDGGHTELILGLGGRVIGLDQDQNAIERAYVRLSDKYRVSKQKTLDWKDAVLVWSSFGDLDNVLKELEIKKIDGVLFDLGVSTLQLLDGDRGFSFSKEAPLDMRMDRDSMAVTAADLVNGLSEKELTTLFIELGGEHSARSIAKAILLKRQKQKITTTTELAKLIEKIKTYPSKIHPATKVFQALRMAVNSERLVLRQALPKAFEALDSKGRLVVMSFHEGEDTIVKDFFKNIVENKLAMSLTAKPEVPTESEVEINRRSRSTKLRAVEKI